MRQRHSGFTLIEIVVVLAIMGFLVAMVAPRLGRYVKDSFTAIDQTSQSRLTDALGSYVEKNNRLPNNLTTLVQDMGGGYDPAHFDDEELTSGPEELSRYFNMNLKPQLHILSDPEAAELRAMGVTTVLALNVNSDAFPDWNRGATYTAPAGSYLDRRNVEDGLAVLMVGAGDDGSGWVFPDDNLFKGNGLAVKAVDPEYHVVLGEHSYEMHALWSDPRLLYRIVLGLGRDNSLITDGVLKSGGSMAANSVRNDHVIFNDFCIAVPRLRATVQRFLDGEADAAPRYLAAQGMATGAVTRFIDLSQAQELHQFQILSPEGAPWPGSADGDKLWRVCGSSDWTGPNNGELPSSHWDATNFGSVPTSGDWTIEN